MVAHRIRLIHWNASEAHARIAKLEKTGYKVEFSQFSPSLFRELRANPPEAVLIDLTRLPSQGRDVAMSLRSYKATRSVPILFLEGGPAKVHLIKSQLPDTVFSTWDDFQRPLKDAIRRGATVAFEPRTRLEGYANKPLPEKLGIKKGSIVSIINPPLDFNKTLGRLPESAILKDHVEGSDLTIWFVRSKHELEADVKSIAGRAGTGGLWIAWPKKTSGHDTDLSEVVVRKAGLAAGIVDYKIASIDLTWSGLRFSVKKRVQGPRPRASRR